MLLSSAQLHRALRQGLRCCLVQIKSPPPATEAAAADAPADAPAEDPRITALKRRFARVFQELPDGVPPNGGEFHVIELEPDAKAPFKGLYRLSPVERAEMEVQIKELLRKGLIALTHIKLSYASKGAQPQHTLTTRALTHRTQNPEKGVLPWSGFLYARMPRCATRRFMKMFLCCMIISALFCLCNMKFSGFDTSNQTGCPWLQDNIKASFYEFVKVYYNRPFQENNGGGRFDHSFAVWHMLRHLNPSIVIESGIFHGHSTWLIRQALPDTVIYAIDPMCPIWKDKNDKTIYLCGSTFHDFNDIEWKINPSQSVIFFDDHQSALKRIFQALTHGFTRFIFDDNYDSGTGDNQSLRRAFESNMSYFDGKYRDNFNSRQSNLSWKVHSVLKNIFQTGISVCEFPPVFPEALTNQSRYTVARLMNKPLISDSSIFRDTRLQLNLPLSEFNGYTYIAYVEYPISKP